MTRRWTLRLAAGLAAGTALFSGCSGEQAASGTLPSADATSSSPAAEFPPLGPADLPMPAEARTQDAAGAEAFVRYYIALINRTSTVMDAAPLREFSQNCEECNRLATNTESSAAAGRAYEGGKIEITESTPPLLTDAKAEMAIRVDQEPLRVLGPDGAEIPDEGSPAFTGVPGTAAAEWQSTQESWVITTLAFG